nr:DUF1707 domain-containing protein [uncultured Actinoplanes sp.]
MTPRVRASNGQREHVVEQLNKALVEGRISPAEFGERSTAASGAVWADELSPFTGDLPRRATFSQRISVVEQLGEAAAQGYLRFPEFEERSAAANQAVWSDELAQFTHDLPAAFHFVPEHQAAPKSAPAAARRKAPSRTAMVVVLMALSAGIGVPLSVMTDEAAPIVAGSVVVPSPNPSSAVVSAPTTAPAVVRTTSAPAPSAAPSFTIECSAGQSGDKVTFTSLKSAWAENGGTYSCEAAVPESHRLTKLENAAVVMDQRIGNGESNIESLEALVSLCADTMKFEFNYDDLLDPKAEPRPYTADDFTKFDPDRLAAVYKLCPGAPTARRMREAIYSR